MILELVKVHKLLVLWQYFGYLPRLLVSCWESQRKRTQRRDDQLYDQPLWCNCIPEKWLTSLELHFPAPLHLGVQVISSPLPNEIYYFVLFVCNDIYVTTGFFEAPFLLCQLDIGKDPPMGDGGVSDWKSTVFLIQNIEEAACLPGKPHMGLS